MLFWVYAEMKSVSDWFTTCVKISPRTYVLSLVNARRLIRPHFQLLSGLYFRNAAAGFAAASCVDTSKVRSGLVTRVRRFPEADTGEEEEEEKSWGCEFFYAF